MELSFANRLAQANRANKNHLCIGIDPHFSEMTGGFFREQVKRLSRAEFIRAVGRELIGVAAENHIGSVKFQSAFFEAVGVEGMQVLKDLIFDAKQLGLITILDVKRGDISTTMQAYGKACFDEFGADAMTVLPYMGMETLKALLPWLQQGKGAYLVWISSNVGSEWIQEPVAAEILMRLRDWQAEHEVTGSTGLVLGATKVESIAEDIFNKAIGYPLLLPGVGAQGARVGRRLSRLSRECPSHIIPISRGISLFGLSGAEHDLADCGSWSEYRELCGSRASQFLSQV